MSEEWAWNGDGKTIRIERVVFTFKGANPEPKWENVVQGVVTEIPHGLMEQAEVICKAHNDAIEEAYNKGYAASTDEW